MYFSNKQHRLAWIAMRVLVVAALANGILAAAMSFGVGGFKAQFAKNELFVYLTCFGALVCVGLCMILERRMSRAEAAHRAIVAALDRLDYLWKKASFSIFGEVGSLSLREGDICFSVTKPRDGGYLISNRGSAALVSPNFLVSAYAVEAVVSRGISVFSIEQMSHSELSKFQAFSRLLMSPNLRVETHDCQEAFEEMLAHREPILP